MQAYYELESIYGDREIGAAQVATLWDAQIVKNRSTNKNDTGKCQSQGETAKTAGNDKKD